MSEPLHVPGTSLRDWPQDFPHENGEYVNTCWNCEKPFFGHKRRRVCQSCTEALREAEASHDR